ncbi:2-C-methyl-D-erythritol 4-phosphate cytidylyltransferase [Brevibacterium aurantiacum]|uniref:IspD/TarI family cytidylyltransferase n=1 Tax=Brevibacterium aurantiacum TaxID=273384 RepID=UPI0028C438DD|nr:2-C-methyl-D-erythritol 4-phosphate cytidylyltransferase [Brevibacterium aurantiacum]
MRGRGHSGRSARVLNICVIVPAAGSGTRLGSADPKALVRLNGKSLLARSLEAIISSGVASTIVVAAPEEFLMRARNEIDSISESGAKDSESNMSGMRITAVAGGEDRIESVQLALKYAGDADVVLVHDAARALTPSEVFRRVADAVRAGAEAVVPVLPMTDTVRRVESRPAVNSDHRPTMNDHRPTTNDGRRAPRSQPDADGWQVVVESGAENDQKLPTVEVLHGDLDRSRLRRVQTPQGFTASTLRRAHERYEDDLAALGPGSLAATDDAGLVERLGIEVVAVDGDEEALKITYPLDLVLGEHIATKRDTETTRDATKRDTETTRDATQQESATIDAQATLDEGEKQNPASEGEQRR